MEYVMFYIMILLILFVVIYIFDFTIKTKNNSLGLQHSFQYIVRRYDLKMNKQKVRTLSKIICFANAFIVSIPLTFILLANINYIFALIISFISFLILIISVYNLVGVILKKKGW